MILTNLIFENFFIGAKTSTVVTPVVQPVDTDGSARPRRRHEFVVEIAGEYFAFSSFDEAVLFLSQNSEFTEEIEAKAEKDALRIVKVGRAKAKPKPPSVKVKGPEAGPDALKAIERAVDRAYWRALASSLAEIAEEEEDILFIASIS